MTSRSLTRPSDAFVLTTKSATIQLLYVADSFGENVCNVSFISLFVVANFLSSQATLTRRLEREGPAPFRKRHFWLIQHFESALAATGAYASGALRSRRCIGHSSARLAAISGTEAVAVLHRS